MDLKQKTIDTYNKSAKELAKKFNGQDARVVDIEKAFSIVKKENPFVLEIGCGNGRDAAEIIKGTSHYLGLDISEELIKIAKTENPKANFEVADIEKYTLPKNIDIIFAFASLLHVNKENVEMILDKAYEALNENGIFFVSLKYGEYHEETKEDDFGVRTYYIYTPELIADLATEYKVVEQEVQDIRGQKWFTIILQK